MNTNNNCGDFGGNSYYCCHSRGIKKMKFLVIIFTAVAFVEVLVVVGLELHEHFRNKSKDNGDSEV